MDALAGLLDDFIVRAFLAGAGIALVAGPLGCVVVWRRMAFFGDALAHAGLLGVALAVSLGAGGTLGIGLGVALVAGASGLILYMLEGKRGVAGDTALGIVAHGGLAAAVTLLALAGPGNVDIEALLFGDILTIDWLGVAWVWLGAALVLAALARFWTALLALTVSPDVAAAEQAHPDRARLAFVLMVAATVALAIKLVGALLVTALLVVPAATARRLAGGPESMAALAAVCGLASVTLGLGASLLADAPAGPAIVLAAVALFALSLPMRRA